MRGLDWFTFFLADIQTGFGPFVAVYLTAQAWSQGDIGLVLTVGGLVALAGQIPAGIIVDSARSTRAIAMAAVALISVSALAIAGWPIFAVVLGARVLHAAASCILGPTIAALSLGLAGHAGLGERLGRNARFASIGAGVAALAMGATGHFFTGQGVFIFTAILVVPALGALKAIKPGELVGKPIRKAGSASEAGFRTLLTNRSLLIFAGAIVAFHLANTAMLPLMSAIITKHSEADMATVWVAACMIVPQIIVATASPFVGRVAESWGRHPLLLICFAALILRGVVFALGSNPYLVVGAQALDGVSAAVLAVLFPLIIADITIGTGRFNVALGLVGSAMGVGAAISPTMAGFAFDHFGGTVAFLGLAAIATAGLLIVLVMMPETKPSKARSSTLKFGPLSKSLKFASTTKLGGVAIPTRARTEIAQLSLATDSDDLRSSV